MNKKNSLNEDEFKKLVEKLSHRKEELEGRITIDLVRDSLRELGLSDVFHDTDIEEVRKQVNKEFKRRQFKNYLIFGFLLIILTAPAAAFGGYKLREFIAIKYPEIFGYYPNEASLPIASLENQIEELQADKEKLEQRLKDSKNENDKLEEKIEEIKNENDKFKKSDEANIPAPPSNIIPSSETTTSSSQSVEYQGLIFELQRCQKSRVNPDSQSINCSLLVTSIQENVELYIYSYSSGNQRSRIVESGKEKLADRVELGVYSNNSKVSNSLLKDSPMEASLTFDKVPLDISKIGVLEISSYLKSSNFSDYIKVEFRDIPLSES